MIKLGFIIVLIIVSSKYPLLEFNADKVNTNASTSRLREELGELNEYGGFSTVNRTHINYPKSSQPKPVLNRPITHLKSEEIASDALLQGKYWDYGNDTDGDGKFNQLIIITEINVTIETVYNITMNLQSAASYFSWQQRSTEYCVIGLQNISIPFNVAEIYSEELITTFIVTKTQITVNSLLIDEDYSNYTTQTFPYTAFNPPPVYYSGSTFHIIEDNNNNGYFEVFYFGVSFDFAVDGYYTFNLSYRTTSDNHSNWIAVSKHCWEGNENIEFNLETRSLYLRKVNTSYSLDSVTTVEYQNHIGTVRLNYVTPIFDFNDFEPPAVQPTGKHWDYGVDTNSNGKINSLAVIIELDVTLPWSGVYTRYHISVDLSFGTVIRSVTSTVQFYQNGLVNKTFFFDTSTFYSYFTFSERNSTNFNVSWIRITNTFSEIVYESYLSFTTSDYFYYNFDSPIIAIEENNHFVFIASLEGWKGSGTFEDPYLIERLFLNGTTFSFPIIEIRNTQIHFIIQDCILLGSDMGIKFVNVENGFIRNNTFVHTNVGIDLHYCANIDISENSFESDESIGVIAEQVQNISISDNDITNTERAIIIQHARDISICKNIISSYDGWTGIDLEDVNYSNITYNRISGFYFTGILLEICTYMDISLNILYQNDNGIQIGGSQSFPPYSSQFNIISTNLICENNAYGVHLDSLSTLNLIERNIFSNDYANGSYLAFDSGKNNTFFQNYWDESAESSIDGGTNKDLHPLIKANHLSPPMMIRPNGGEEYSSVVIIQWEGAKDLFNQTLEYSIYYSSNNGFTWHFLSSEYGTSFINGLKKYKHEWTINKSEIIPGSSYLIQVIVSDPFGFIQMASSNSTFTLSVQKSHFPSTTLYRILFLTLIVMILFLVRKRKKPL